ncbi:unnamed protein product [Trichobilharzia szidati]|nr:unnamed protein product [Trichobilharzia szidati]
MKVFVQILLAVLCSVFLLSQIAESYRNPIGYDNDAFNGYEDYMSPISREIQKRVQFLRLGKRFAEK